MSALTSLFLVCFYFSFSFQLGISAFDNVDFRVKRETLDQCSASLQSKDLENQRLLSALQTNKQQLDELQSQLNDLESTMSQLGNQPVCAPAVCPTPPTDMRHHGRGRPRGHRNNHGFDAGRHRGRHDDARPDAL